MAGFCTDIDSESVVANVVDPALADYQWNTSVPVQSGSYNYCFRLNAYADNESTTPLSGYTPSQVSLSYDVVSPTSAVYTKVVRITFVGEWASIQGVIDQFKEEVKSKILALCPSVTVSSVTLSEGESPE